MADPRADRLTGMLRALDVRSVVVANGPATIEAALTCASKRAILTSASVK